MYSYVWVYVPWVQCPQSLDEGIRSLRDGAIGGCEMPNLSKGDQIQVPHKSRTPKSVLQWNHLICGKTLHKNEMISKSETYNLCSTTGKLKYVRCGYCGVSVYRVRVDTVGSVVSVYRVCVDTVWSVSKGSVWIMCIQCLHSQFTENGLTL